MPEPATALTAADRRLLDYLQARWSTLFRLTTLEQGMLALGQAPRQARRLRVGDYLLQHPEIHPVVERWGARTFILTEGEKLLGRYLSLRAAAGRGHSSAAEAAAALGQAEGHREHVRRALAALAHVGLLTWSVRRDVVTYSFAPHWEQLAGPLGFTYHTVQLASGERFNVP